MSKANSDTIAERRLRPIYDWLDNGNNKKAVQEADKVLKKQPELLCAQVLKGLALLRLGKPKDCEDILEIVHQKIPADDCTLQAMTICYREIHQLEKICDIYEKAVSKDPQNEELNTHLFMSYVRVGDYKKQQQVALNLHKMKPKNPYYFWGIMSIIMQAQIADDKIAQKVLLPLAERMINNFISEGKIEAEQEIQLYIMVLEMQKKYQEALDFIDSELGQRIVSYHLLPRRRMKLLELLGKWLELNVYAKRIILEQPDSYHNYAIYIDSVIKLIASGEGCESTDEQTETNYNSFNGEILKADNTVELCIDFIRRCEKNESGSYKLRGPYLAMLLLYRKLGEQGFDAMKYLGNPLLMFEEYFRLFADKPCCFKDLCQFLPLIQDDRTSLLSSAWHHIEEMNNSQVMIKKQLMMYLTYFQISRYFGTSKHHTEAEKLAQVSKLLSFYFDGLQFNVDLSATDLGCSDTFLVVIAHNLHDLFLETNNFKFIKDAICLLLYGYHNSPSNHHFKLLLLKLYNMLGASNVSYKYFQSLEIKHMQYDSLGYVECWPLLHSGQYPLAVHLLDSTLKFFTVNYREAADQLTYAYKYGSFEKVNEFLNFREKLKNSHHYCLVCIEHTILELIHSACHQSTLQAALSVQQSIANLEEMSANNFINLVDNRDLLIFLNFERPIDDKMTALSFQHEKTLIRVRMLMLRCIGLSIKICSTNVLNSNSSAAGEKSSQSNGIDHSSFNIEFLQRLQSTIEELREVHKLILSDSTRRFPKDTLNGIESSRLFLYAESFFVPIFINTMLFVHKFCKHYFTKCLTEEQLKQVADSSLTEFSNLINGINERLRTTVNSPNKTDYRDLFENLSLVIEVICIMSVMCGNLHSLYLITNKKVTPMKKKKKKGKVLSSKPASGADEESASENHQETHDRVQQILKNYLNTIINSVGTFETSLLNTVSNWTPLEPQEPAFQISQRGSDGAAENEFKFISNKTWSHLQSHLNRSLEESYKSSLTEFINVMSRKQEYLSSLIL